MCKQPHICGQAAVKCALPAPLASLAADASVASWETQAQVFASLAGRSLRSEFCAQTTESKRPLAMSCMTWPMRDDVSVGSSTQGFSMSLCCGSSNTKYSKRLRAEHCCTLLLLAGDYFPCRNLTPTSRRRSIHGRSEEVFSGSMCS